MTTGREAWPVCGECRPPPFVRDSGCIEQSGRKFAVQWVPRGRHRLISRHLVAARPLSFRRLTFLQAHHHARTPLTIRFTRRISGRMVSARSALALSICRDSLRWRKRGRPLLQAARTSHRRMCELRRADMDALKGNSFEPCTQPGLIAARVASLEFRWRG